jgi:hypothetical protein
MGSDITLKRSPQGKKMSFLLLLLRLRSEINANEFSSAQVHFCLAKNCLNGKILFLFFSKNNYLGLTKSSKNAIANFIHQLALKSFLHE